MQQAIFKVNAVKRVAKIYIKIMFKIWQLRQRHKTKSKNGTKYVENATMLQLISYSKKLRQCEITGISN